MKADAWLLDKGQSTISIRDRWGRFVERWLPTIVLYLMVAALMIIVISPRVVVTVPRGEVGVLWKRFEGGTVLDP